MEGGSKPRFGDVSDETLLQMITESKLATRTQPGRTTTSLRVVSDYRSEKGLKISFAPCSAEELATFLEKFYVVNTARAPTLPHKRLRNDICECRSDLSTFLPPTS